MVTTAHGLPSLSELSEKHGARLAFRLRALYLPGPAPFPQSPEEAEWLAEHERLTVTVLGLPQGWLVSVELTRGDDESGDRRELPTAALASFPAELETLGGWSLPAFAPLASPPGVIELEHEAYEYHDHDPESLDLDAWSPPRRWRVQRSRAGNDEGATRRLLAAYVRLAGVVAGGSRFAAAAR